MAREEKRRYQRVTLPNPLRSDVSGVRAYVVDLSVMGVRVAHQDALPGPGGKCSVKFEGVSGPISLDCLVVHTMVHRPARTQGERPVYHSGLQIVTARHESDRALRELIGHFIDRAMDEQRANARGIPASAAVSFQTGKGTEFLKVELLAGRWRRTLTKDSQQPPNGFTISASEHEDNIVMLCEAFESADTDGRRLIRTMAELATSKAEGIPTRRYDP
ncbi:MAG: hypothetical protein QOI24_4597 [Acidobacteriota bacterium]|nr:hypothetical protein [Acidobacteriota bacterium]